jgi:hypothetical protein
LVVAGEAATGIVVRSPHWKCGCGARAAMISYTGKLYQWLQSVLYFDLPPWVFILFSDLFGSGAMGLSTRFRRSQRISQNLSSASATPCPPPMHSVASLYCVSAASRCSSVTSTRRGCADRIFH